MVINFDSMSSDELCKCACQSLNFLNSHVRCGVSDVGVIDDLYLMTLRRYCREFLELNLRTINV